MEWLTVHTDPAALAAARERVAQSELRELDAFFADFQTIHVEPRVLSLLALHREAALERLRALSSGEGELARIQALALCARLEAGDGVSGLAAELERGSRNARSDALLRLMWYAAPSVAARRDAGLFARILDALEADDELAQYAILACVALERAGAAPRLRAVLRGPRPALKAAAGAALAKLDPRRDDLQHALDAFEREDGGSRSWPAMTVASFARCADAGVRVAARDGLMVMLVRLKPQLADLPEHGAGRSELEAMVHTVLVDATPADRDWLIALRDAKLSRYTRLAWLRALARADREAARPLLEAALLEEGCQLAAAALGEMFGGTRDARAVKLLLAAADKADRWTHTAFARALLRIDGPASVPDAARLCRGVSRAGQAYVLRDVAWGARGWRADALADVVAQTGALDADSYRAAVERLRAGAREHRGTLDDVDLESVLWAAGRGFLQDVESGFVPCRHDELLERFAACSAGAFAPEDVHQEWSGRADPRTPGAGYVLQFRHARSLFRAELRDLGDHYDLQRMLALVNRALELGGAAVRFHELEVIDQCARYVLATPAAADALATGLLLPIARERRPAQEPIEETLQRAFA